MNDDKKDDQTPTGSGTEIVGPVPQIIPLTAGIAVEHGLERQYVYIGATLDLNKVMPSGVKWQSFSKKYVEFRKVVPTPGTLSEVDDHARAFIDYAGYTEAKAEGAVVWVIWRVWELKGKSKLILDADARRDVLNAIEARKLIFVNRNRSQQKISLPRRISDSEHEDRLATLIAVGKYANIHQ
ncbi:MAG: hypothetical protein U9R74_04550 [Pseudomonadota bacterium]|nr:hypothetical protein [Pseudomonadota bacterium]